MKTAWCCWLFKVKTRKWIYFPCSQAEAKRMAADLRAKGHPAYAAHGTDKAPFMPSGAK